MRGYIYGVFRCEVNEKTGEVDATFPDWQEPIFLLFQWVFGVLADLSGVEPVFPIKIYDKK